MEVPECWWGWRWHGGWDGRRSLRCQRSRTSGSGRVRSDTVGGSRRWWPRPGTPSRPSSGCGRPVSGTRTVWRDRRRSCSPRSRCWRPDGRRRYRPSCDGPCPTDGSRRWRYWSLPICAWKKNIFIKCHWTIVSRYPWVHCAVNSMRSMIPWVVSEALQKYKRWNRYYVYTAGECEKPLGQKMENKNNANRTRCCDDRRRGCEQPRQGRARRFTRWRPSPGRIGISWRGKTRSSFAWSTIVSSLSLSLSFSHSLILSFSLSIWTWRHGKCVPSVFWSQVRTDFSDQFCSLKNKTRYRWPIDRVCRLRTCVALTARPDHWSHAGELLRFFEFHCLVGSVHPKNHPILLPSSMAH